jgi:two-component system NtrC family sensor kinase
MKIRWKVTALIAALFAVLGIAEIFVAKTVLMRSFADLEHSDAETAMRRTNYALDQALDQLVLSATGWGNWTDAYRFAEDHNKTFVQENITVVGLKQLNVNELVIVDLTGKVLTSAAMDLRSTKAFDLDFVADGALVADFPWRANLGTTRTTKGLLRTRHGVLMISAAPILDGFGEGPPRGMVLMGRLLTPAEIKHLGAQVQVDLSLIAPSTSPVANGLIDTDQVAQIYHTFADIYGSPIMTLRIDIPRKITERGELAVTYASAYLAAAAVIVLVLLVFILNRVILDPLARVTRHAVALGEAKDLTTRLDFKGSDEISVLAREFDHMVARLAESRSRLVDQSFHAGFAELAKGVLHNLGNAMTPIGVRLSGLRGRLHAAPADDAEVGLEELARGGVDPTRRADLEEFMRLACAELASVVKTAREDVEVMTRQTAIVQSALSEQMRATRNENVVEYVRLPELLAQSLEVVPDAARSFLLVESDQSLKAAGTLRLPRTILRLVLQNLIINAADSVRDSGQLRGKLIVAADIVQSEDAVKLLLRVSDNGVGIRADGLERIFEKGFSTKSKETNYGIGLHWCANSVGALGGRIWATSDGLGRGASIHILLPLAADDCVSVVRAA